jgi:hypothetical protein
MASWLIINKVGATLVVAFEEDKGDMEDMETR